ncbi:MAG TPA: hypothetical protein VF765_21785 [Polyangiaceae bacterium]
MRCWLASGLVALLCVACDLPRNGAGDPPPEPSVTADASEPDVYVPVKNVDAGGTAPHDASAPFPKEGGALDAAPSTDSPDDARGDDGGDEGHGGDRPIEPH